MDKMDDFSFKVRVEGDLCHRSGYVQNGSVINLNFSGSTSKAIPIISGPYALTVFVGASFGRANVDYSVKLIPGPAIQLHVPGNNPIRAKTVGMTGFVVIEFTLS